MLAAERTVKGVDPFPLASVRPNGWAANCAPQPRALSSLGVRHSERWNFWFGRKPLTDTVTCCASWSPAEGVTVSPPASNFTSCLVVVVVVGWDVADRVPAPQPAVTRTMRASPISPDKGRIMPELGTGILGECDSGQPAPVRRFGGKVSSTAKRRSAPMPGHRQHLVLLQPASLRLGRFASRRPHKGRRLSR